MASSPLSLCSRHWMPVRRALWARCTAHRCCPQQTHHQLKTSSHAASCQLVTWVTNPHPRPAGETCRVWRSRWGTRKNRPHKRSRIPRKDWRSDCWYTRENSGWVLNSSGRGLKFLWHAASVRFKCNMNGKKTMWDIKHISLKTHLKGGKKAILLVSLTFSERGQYN